MPNPVLIYHDGESAEVLHTLNGFLQGADLGAKGLKVFDPGYQNTAISK
jgi:hypothetical protein